MKRRQISCLVAAVAFAGVATVVLYQVEAYQDFDYVCLNTASTKGYRHWFFGTETGHRYEESPLERYMRERHIAELTNRWCSYNGTGYNVFGVARSWGHGDPGEMVYFVSFPADLLSRWAEHADEEQMYALYRLFVSDDQPKIRERHSAMVEEVYQQRIHPSHAPPGTARGLAAPGR